MARKSKASKVQKTPAQGSSLVYVTSDVLAKFHNLSGTELKLKTRALEEFLGVKVKVFALGIFEAEDGSPVFFTQNSGEVLGTWGKRLRIIADGQILLVKPSVDTQGHSPTYMFFSNVQ